MSYCGVDSHNQNGIAERRIKSLSEDARTMLAHGIHIWSEVITRALWPFALKAACRARNKFNFDSDGLSSGAKMSKVQVKSHIKNEHPLLYPVFTLDKKLQGGIGGIPKWNPRSNAGVYLGHSPNHASNVALVLNLMTGLISPQDHVVFDDTFSTVEFIRSQKEPSNWENLCKNHTENFRMHTSAVMPNTMTNDGNFDWLTSITEDQPSVLTEEFSSSQKPSVQPSNDNEGDDFPQSEPREGGTTITGNDDSANGTASERAGTNDQAEVNENANSQINKVQQATPNNIIDDIPVRRSSQVRRA